jgi:hypothetical protein
MSSTSPTVSTTDRVVPAIHQPVLDVSAFPTAIQAQLAQFTIDLQDYKPSWTSLACVACRNKKIKCSGDRPVCSACARSEDGRSCEYPAGHRKRRRNIDAEPGRSHSTMQATRERYEEAGDEDTECSVRKRIMRRSNYVMEREDSQNVGDEFLFPTEQLDHADERSGAIENRPGPRTKSPRTVLPNDQSSTSDFPGSYDGGLDHRQDRPEDDLSPHPLASDMNREWDWSLFDQAQDERPARAGPSLSTSTLPPQLNTMDTLSMAIDASGRNEQGRGKSPVPQPAKVRVPYFR